MIENGSFLKRMEKSPVGTISQVSPIAAELVQKLKDTHLNEL
jgi:hypothetical protein